MSVSAFPLTWPVGFPQSKHREKGQFRTILGAAALNDVRGSLQLFGRDSGKPVSDIVITSNVSLGVDNPPDPGVAVWLAWDGMTVCIPVDRYSSAAANLQAIHHVLEARRVELRHGSRDDIDRAIDELFLDTAAVEVGGALLVAQTY